MSTLHSTTPQTREDRAIYRALKLLESRMRQPGATLSSPGDVRDYLRLALASEEREVFMALWLDAQHGLIEADAMFYGTLTQTTVYPREVVKRSLNLNAGCVIFAHNHPSGIPEPSNADLRLTAALKESLALVDVRVLDHFIVAGNALLSFAERGILGMSELPQEPLPAAAATPAKRRGRPRKATSAACGMRQK